MKREVSKILRYRILLAVVACVACLSAHAQDRGALRDVDSVAVNPQPGFWFISGVKFTF